MADGIPRNANPTAALPPEAYKAKYFAYGDSDGSLSTIVRKNPVLDLCCRLSTLRTYKDAHGQIRISDPKHRNKPTSRLYGKRRLYHMVGYKLRPSTFNRLRLLSKDQWKFIEECWIANMHTVVLSVDFDPVKQDPALVRSIQTYKVWFLEFALQGRLNKRRVSLKNREKLLKGLKQIAGYLQWCLLSDGQNEDAPLPKYWKGYNSVTDRITLTWFAGHLQKWRNPHNIVRDDNNLTNLCQIRTFGRALPPATKAMCLSDLVDQIKVLTNEPEVPDLVLNAVKVAASKLASKLKFEEMPLRSHISLSNSGCFENPGSQGGLAEYVRKEYIAPLLDASIRDVTVDMYHCEKIPFREWYNTFLIGPESSCYWKTNNPRDCYGNVMFPRNAITHLPTVFFEDMMDEGPWSFTGEASRRTLIDYFYRESSVDDRDRKIRSIFSNAGVKGKPMPPWVGTIILMVATAEAATQGHFVDLKGNIVRPWGTINVPNLKFKIPFYEKGPLRYVPDSLPKVRMTCLAEPGAKARTLGQSQVWFTMVSRVMRFMAEPIIARDGRARIGLRSTNKMWSYLKFLQNNVQPGHDTVLQSSDYKASTDYIPLSIISVLWKAFFHDVDKRHPCLVFDSLMACPRELSIKDKINYNGSLIHKCGSFMGEPMSFLTLNSMNLVVEEVSAYVYATADKTYRNIGLRSFPLGGDPTCICGDDVGAVRANLRRILIFKDVAKDCGFRLSWKDGWSKRIMIFCEDHILLTQDPNTNKHKFVYIDVIKSRLLTPMTRQHSDNRSSILSKGRMLRNQLDYVEESARKVAVLEIYHKIFSRQYSGETDRLRLPFFLPPSAGGVGYPIKESLIPKWGYKFIKFVYQVLDIENWHDRYIAICELRKLNSPSKKGIQTLNESLEIVRETIGRFHHYISDEEPKEILSDVVYPDQVVQRLLEINNRVPVSDPYTGRYDRSSFENEAYNIGFVPITHYLDEVERSLNFQTFLTSNEVRDQRTFNKWMKDSAKFWKKKGVLDLREDPFWTLPENFTFAKLEKDLLLSITGWIYLGYSQITPINSGPSLKLDFGSSRFAHYRPFYRKENTEQSLIIQEDPVLPSDSDEEEA